MRSPRISAGCWLLLACLSGVLALAFAFDGLVLLTIVLLVVVVLFTIAATLTHLDHWLIGNTAPSMPEPAPIIQTARLFPARRQFSLRTLLLWMVLAAVAWRFLTALPEAIMRVALFPLRWRPRW